MAGKLGPQFALRGFVRSDWMKESLLPEWQFLLQVDEGRTLLLESYNETFKQELVRNVEQQSPWIFCAQILKEDSEQLFAFQTPLERRFFEELRELNSVGPKTAALLIGRLGLDNLYKLYQGEDPKQFKVTGVGPKTLEKIARQLQDQSKKMEALFLSYNSSFGGEKRGSVISVPSKQLPPLVVSGLEQLGMKSAEIQKVFGELLAENTEVTKLSVGDLMRLCLKKWGQMKNPGALAQEGSL